MTYPDMERIHEPDHEGWPKYCPVCGRPLAQDIVRFDPFTGASTGLGMVCPRSSPAHYAWMPGDDPYTGTGVRVR